MLWRYPKPHSQFVSVTTRPVSRSITSTRMIVSLTSCPYAPTFWIGVAPVSPGIPERHSMPAHPRVTANTTKSSHLSPAATYTLTASASSSRTVMPRRSICRTTPSNPSSAISTLLPPPRMKSGSFCEAVQESASRISSTVSARMKILAGPPMPRVVKGASGTFRCSRRGATLCNDCVIAVALCIIAA